MRCSVKGSEDIPLEPIYCDNHLLILEKPAGVATQPDFHEAAKSYIKEAFQKPGKVFLEPIHRLDKPVGGLVLFARTSKALSRLNEEMRERKIVKKYRALVEGVVEEAGVLEHFLVHGSHKALVDPRGKRAVLRFRRLQVVNNQSLVEIELETGRYHQIRAQFAAIGHPVVGDVKYGAKTPRAAIALYHYEMQLIHPTTKERLTVRSRGDLSF
jgi:23S rRNA pseudouridine1911/1915/1917 synthase